MSSPVNKKSSSGSRSFDYCRFIELDYTPMEAGIMVSMRQSRGFLSPKSPERHNRKSPAPVSNRDPYGNTSLSSSSNSGSCKGSDCSPTHRRHMKYTSCTDNHGIKPPPPEQYLTPLQQKEVCIRHLRARLKDTVERLQDRDTEIDELRTQLSRMQEDWIEEECHRVEAQLALKEARREIQQLKQVVDMVRSSLGETDSGVQKCFQDINVQNLKLETLLQSMEIAQTGAEKEGQVPNGGGGVGAGQWVSEGPVRSCEGSPARSLTRSSTYTKVSELAGPEHNGSGSGSGSDMACCLSADGTQDSGFVCCGELEGGGATRAELLLEATCLSEETASLLNVCSRLPHSATYEALSHGEARTLPLRCSLGRAAGGGPAASISHPCLSHHHLYLHHLREQAIQTEYDFAPASAPAIGAAFGSELDTIAEVRTFRSQACSPTSTWMSDDGDDLDSVTMESVVTATTGGKVIVTELYPEPLPVSSATMVPLPLESDNKVSATVSTFADNNVAESVNQTAPAMPATDTVLDSLTTDQQPSPGITSCPVQVTPLLEENIDPVPQTTQPQGAASQVNINGVTIIEVDKDNEDDKEQGAAAEENDCGEPVKSYWSRHFLVDLLAVVVPVVPTVAWFCRGQRSGSQPFYHFGALLRGCCTVALHSLRRGGGLRHYPAGGGGPGGMSI